MLGGTAPVLVFNFGSVDILGFDVPLWSIPVYLDENLTGILVDEHERSINIEFETDGENNYERAISSDVRITLISQKDNIALKGFLALFEQVLKRVNTKAYKLYFYYDDVFMTDASLKDFNSSIRQGTDTRVVTFTLTNRSEKSQVLNTILKKVGDSLKGFFK